MYADYGETVSKTCISLLLYIRNNWIELRPFKKKTQQKTPPKTTYIVALVWRVYACRGVEHKAYLNRACMTKAHLKCLRSRHVVCEFYLKLTSMVVETMLQLCSSSVAIFLDRRRFSAVTLAVKQSSAVHRWWKPAGFQLLHTFTLVDWMVYILF